MSGAQPQAQQYDDYSYNSGADDFSNYDDAPAPAAGGGTGGGGQAQELQEYDDDGGQQGYADQGLYDDDDGQGYADDGQGSYDQGQQQSYADDGQQSYADDGQGNADVGRGYDDQGYDQGVGDQQQYADDVQSYDEGYNDGQQQRQPQPAGGYDQGQELEVDFNDEQGQQQQQGGEYVEEYDDQQQQGDGEYVEEYGDQQQQGDGEYVEEYNDDDGGGVTGAVVVAAAAGQEYEEDYNDAGEFVDDQYDDGQVQDVVYDDPQGGGNDPQTVGGGFDDDDDEAYGDGGYVDEEAGQATTSGSTYGDAVHSEAHGQDAAVVVVAADGDDDADGDASHEDDPYSDSGGGASSSRGPERTPEGMADPNVLDADGGDLLAAQKEKNARQEEEQREQQEARVALAALQQQKDISVQSMQYNDQDYGGPDDEDDGHLEVVHEKDDMLMADDESFDPDKEESRRHKWHGRLCGPCPILFCVQCFACLAIIGGIIAVIVVGTTGDTFNHEKIAEAMGLSDGEESNIAENITTSLRPVASTTLAPTPMPVSSTVATTTSRPSPAPVTPTEAPTAFPTTDSPTTAAPQASEEIAVKDTAGPEFDYSIPACTKKQALFYLDFTGVSDGEGEGGASTTSADLSGSVKIRGTGKKAPLLYETEIVNGMFSTASGPWLCLEKTKCHAVEASLESAVDLTTTSGEAGEDGGVGWSLHSTEPPPPGPNATSGEGVVEIKADARPVASGLISLVGAGAAATAKAAEDGSCRFSTPPFKAKMAGGCPITCDKGEYSSAKYPPVEDPPSTGTGTGGKKGGKRDPADASRLSKRTGGCKNKSLLHELVFVGTTAAALPPNLADDGMAVIVKASNGKEPLKAPLVDLTAADLNPTKSIDTDAARYVCLQRNACYSASVVSEDGLTPPPSQSDSDLRWELRRVMTGGRNKKKWGKYGEAPLASGKLFGGGGGLEEEGGIGIGGCSFAMPPGKKKGGANAAAPTCDLAACEVHNIFEPAVDG